MEDSDLLNSSEIENFDNNSYANFSNATFMCAYYPLTYLKTEFYMVSVVGTSIAAISIINNSILLYLFLTRPYFRRSVFFYITVLAALDVLHGIFFIMNMSLAIAFQYTENLVLQVVWHSYFVPVHTLSHIVLFTSTYLLVAASVERFLTANWMSGFCQNRGRFFTLLGLILFAIFSKGSVFFEYQVMHRPYCDGLHKYVVFPTRLMFENPMYKKIWSFWYRNFVSVFIPITLLIVLNVGIVLQNYFTCISIERDETFAMQYRLRFRTPRKIKRGPKNNPPITFDLEQENGAVRKPMAPRGSGDGLIGTRTVGWVSKARQRVRKAATRTLIAIVGEYLVCNSLAVVLTIWEQIDQNSLDSRTEFYTYASDTVNLLTVISCAIRLPTYCLCDVTLRTELNRMLIGCSQKPRGIPMISSEADLNDARNILIRQRLIQSMNTSSDVESQPEVKMGFADLVMQAMKEKRDSTASTVASKENFTRENCSNEVSFRDFARKAVQQATEDNPDIDPAPQTPSSQSKSFKSLARKAQGQPLTPFSGLLKQLKAQAEIEKNAESSAQNAGEGSQNPQKEKTKSSEPDSSNAQTHAKPETAPNLHTTKLWTRSGDRPMAFLKKQDSQGRKLVRQLEIKESENPVNADTKQVIQTKVTVTNGSTRTTVDNGHQPLSQSNSLLDTEQFV